MGWRRQFLTQEKYKNYPVIKIILALWLAPLNATNPFMDAFSIITAEYGLAAIVVSFAVMLFAGFTKGAIGFALPMIVVSGIGSVMSAEIAIAAMILPGFLTNFWQSIRNGLGQAVASLVKFWRLNVVMLVMIFFCAKLVTMVPPAFLFLTLGGGITFFGTLQIIGWRPNISPPLRNMVEVCTGLLAGFFGGLAGVWGPPILMYLMAMETPKSEQIRVQGVSFLLGSVVLTFAHLNSGVLNAVSLPFSAALMVPASLGMVMGIFVQSKIDQALFRKITLVVLIMAGLNLLRRGFLG